MADPAGENWAVLCSLFPAHWRDHARELGAVERLRGFSSIDGPMRTLLLHDAQGYLLRETAVLPKVPGLSAISDVALLKRLRKAEPWLRSLCLGLLQEQSVQSAPVAKGDGGSAP